MSYRVLVVKIRVKTSIPRRIRKTNRVRTQPTRGIPKIQHSGVHEPLLQTQRT